MSIIHHPLQKKHGIDSGEPSMLHLGWSEILDTIVERYGNKAR